MLLSPLQFFNYVVHQLFLHFRLLVFLEIKYRVQSALFFFLIYFSLFMFVRSEPDNISEPNFNILLNFFLVAFGFLKVFKKITKIKQSSKNWKVFR